MDESRVRDIVKDLQKKEGEKYTYEKEAPAYFKASDMAETVADLQKNLNEQYESSKEIVEEVKNDYKTHFIDLRKMADNFWNLNAVSSMRSAFGEVTSRLRGHLDDILGPLKDFTDMLVNIGKNVLGMFKSLGEDIKGIFGFGRDEDEERDEKRNTLLKRLLNFFVKKDKREQLEEFKAGLKMDEKGLLDRLLLPLGMLFTGLATAIGTMLALIISPFVASTIVIIKGLKKFKFISVIFGKVLGGVFKVIDSIKKFILKIPFIGKILGVFGRTLGRLALPITIIMGIIDFVVGFFISKEKTFMGKFEAGITRMIEKFFELPIAIFDWLLSKLGILEIGEFKEKAGAAIDCIIFQISRIGELFSWIGTKIMNAINYITKGIKAIFNFGPIKAVIDLIKARLTGGEEPELKVYKISRDEKKPSIREEMNIIEREKRKSLIDKEVEANRVNKELLKAQKESNKLMREQTEAVKSSEKSNIQMSSTVASSINQTQIDQKPIPDENEYFGFAFNKAFA